MLTIVVLGQDLDTTATSCFHVYSSCQSCYEACQSKEFNNQINEFNNLCDKFICHQGEFKFPTGQILLLKGLILFPNL